MVDAIKDRIDGILRKQGGVGAIILDQVVTGLNAILVITMQIDKRCVSIGIAADPTIDPQHLRFAQAGGVRVGRTGLVEGVDAAHDQVVESVRGQGAALDLGPGVVGGQPRISHDRVHDAIQSGVGAGQIGFEGGQPAGHIAEQGVVVAVLIGEARAVGAERKTEVIQAVLNGVDQGSAIELAIAAVILNLVKAGGHAPFIITVELDEAG